MIVEQGEREGRIGFPNSWVIDEMVDGDVLVADLFGAVNLVGDNLTTAIKANGGRARIVRGPAFAVVLLSINRIWSWIIWDLVGFEISGICPRLVGIFSRLPPAGG